jgi:hypothetical protein
MDFDEIWYLSFSYICRESRSFIKIWQEKRVLYLKTFSHLWQYLAKCFLEWEMLQTKNIYFVLNNFFSPQKSRHLRDNVENNVWAREATNDNIANKCYMLDKQGYKRALHAHAQALVHPPASTHTHTIHPRTHTRQPWLRERAWVLRHTYIACLI